MCPRQYALVRVHRKVKDPPGIHAQWGNQVHGAIEQRIKNKTPLPEGMQKWEPLVSKFDQVKGQVLTENRVAVTRNLTKAEWNSPSTWFRAIIDLATDDGRTAVLADWKTGKVKQDSSQLRISGAIWMAVRPWIERAKVAFVWLPHDKITSQTLTREHTPAIWEDVMTRMTRLEKAYADDRWPPRPSGLCKGWCPVGREHCEFWQPKTKQ